MPLVEKAELSEEEIQFADELEENRRKEEEFAAKQVYSEEEASRGATEGPLKDLIPVFIDVETFINTEVTLRKQTLRQYARDSHLETVAIAIGEDPVQVFFTDKLEGLTPGCPMLDDRMIGVLTSLAKSPKYIFVAHNAAFDTRILRFMCGVPHPENVWCTLEGAMASWPELPGGYGLDNCSRRLGLPHELRKFKFDLKELNRVRTKIMKTGKEFPVADLTDEIRAEFRRVLRARKVKLPKTLDLATCNLMLEIYNARDVESMREIYYRMAARIPAVEQEVAIRTHRQRKYHFLVDPARLESLIEDMDKNARYAEQQAMEYVTDEQAADVFNRETDDGSLRSIRYQRLRNVINELRTEGEDEFESTSLKKVSPIKLARNPTVAAILEQTSRAGKMVSHKRRAMVFEGVDEVDVELGFCRAHTGRFSSPSVGRGLNLHNCLHRDSLILTKRGWVKVISLKKDDLLWDGNQFVGFQSVTYEGERTTCKVAAAAITSEHPVWDGERMVPSGELSLCQKVLSAAVGLRSTLLGLLSQESSVGASLAEKKLKELSTTYPNLWGAVDVPTDDDLGYMTLGYLKSRSSSFDGDTTTWYTGNIPRDTRTIRCSPGGTGKVYATSGLATLEPSSKTSWKYLDGTIKICKWIESTTKKGIPRTTLDSLMQALTLTTEELLSEQKTESRLQTTVGESVSNITTDTTVSSRAVFDIRGVGPRARFVCDGLVVSNCPKHDKAVAEPIRRTFQLPPHLCLVRADLANVEYRIEGYLTKCQTILEMFDDLLGGDIFTDPYCASWGRMTGISIDKKDPIRQVAKSAVLGLGFCIASGTLIPTVNGLKPIEDVNSDDLVWGGKEWVRVSGAIKTGKKKCILLGNTWLTGDHQVWWNGWRKCGEISTAVDMIRHHVERCSAGGKSQVQSSIKELKGMYPSAASAEIQALLESTNYTVAEALNVVFVPTPDVDSEEAHRVSTLTSSRIHVYGDDGSLVTTTSRKDVATQTTRSGVTMVGVGSNSKCLPGSSCLTLKSYRDGTIGLCSWTGSTTMGTTKQGICDSFLRQKVLETKGREEDVRDVYDIMDAEGGHRFQAGEWLVHNCMSPVGYAKVLLGVLSNKFSGVTEESLKAIIEGNGWRTPPGKVLKRITGILGCSAMVASAAFHIHRVFNEAHPEFATTADWIVRTVQAVAASPAGIDGRDQAKRAIDKMYLSTKAPDRDLIGLEIDDDPIPQYACVRARCGPWPRTVCWREPHARPTDFHGSRQMKLTILKANGFPKPFTRQLAIENVTQAAARNALCMGIAELEKLGFPDCIHVHDEAMMIVPKKRETILAARDAILKVFGPGHALPYRWAVLMKPDEITVTQSMYEDEKDIAPVEKGGNDRWGKIERNEAGCLEDLP